jgi:hypothetical protein
LLGEWAQLQKADEIFMLEEGAGTLVDLLKLHQTVYPPSYQSFQQFSFVLSLQNDKCTSSKQVLSYSLISMLFSGNERYNLNPQLSSFSFANLN